MNDILQKAVDAIREQAQSPDRSGEVCILVDEGTLCAAQKFGEEAKELCSVAVGTDGHLVYDKAAGVLYRLLILLEARRLRFEVAERTLGLQMGIVKPTIMDRTPSLPDHTVFSR